MVVTTTVEDGCSDTRLTNVASMATSTAAAPTAELTLLIDGYLAGAIIGKGGSTLKSIKSASGVLTLQLSQESSVATRTVVLASAVIITHPRRPSGPPPRFSVLPLPQSRRF